MAQDFEERVVLVAGASGGVGRAAARMLLERGAKVALHYRSNAAPLTPMADQFGKDRVILVKGDLTQPEDVHRLVKSSAERFGKLDGFLNTVGTALRMHPFLDIPDATVELTIDVELRSIITSLRAVFPFLIANGGGHAVLIGSDSGKVGTSGEAISAACRGGIIALAKSLAREYARHKVLVNVVCPGPTDTSLWEDLVENDEFGKKIGSAMIRAIPLRRLGRPEEVAATAVFLLSKEASYITGQAISVSGGLTMS
jgi:2-hydroxycyclohexanecarboxyl-CoA dehydrogenase